MVKETKYYDILGISSNASPSEIRKAYNMKAKEYHPDRNKDPNAEEIFKQVSKAYQVLSSPESREKYDNFGENFEEASIDINPFDLFSNIFGMHQPSNPFGGFFRENFQRKGPSINLNLVLTLEDIYFGTVKKMMIKRDEICTMCTGKGCKMGTSPNKCEFCKGQGIIVEVIRNGPIIQQMQRPCKHCSGVGTKINVKDLCPTCKGNKIILTDKQLEFIIQRGTQPGEEIIFPNESHRHPDYISGDIKTLIVLQEHPLFKKENLNLRYFAKVNVIDALTEILLLIPHINGETLLIKHKGPLQSKSKTIAGLGLPNTKDTKIGDLIIDFTIIYPETLNLSEHDREILKSILPPSNNSNIIPDKITTINL